MTLSSRSAQATLDLGRKIVALLSSEEGSKYNVPQSTVQHLTNGDTLLANAVLQQLAILDQSKAATAAKSTQREAVSAIIANIHATVLNDPTVTDEMLLALGFPARRASLRPKPSVASRVSGLVVEPGQGSEVRLRWDRGTNSKSTMFVIETSANGTDWTPMKTTTRVSYVAPGFVPGVAAWFRVTATTSMAEAQPSQPVGVYLPAAVAPQLRLAA